MSLQMLKEEDPVAFLQLALRTKNPEHKFIPGYEEKLRKEFPNLDHDAVKAVLQNAIGGSAWAPRLQDPNRPYTNN